MTLERPYHTGYRAGYLDQQLEDTGAAGTAAPDDPGDLTDEQLSDYWLGYYHGRYHARTGQPAPGATRTAN